MYRGLITCGTCGALVTAKHATNRYGTKYTYYHCCRKERRYRYCPEPAVQEHAIATQVEAFLAELKLPPMWLEAACARIERAVQSGAVAEDDRRKRLESLLSDAAGRLERARRLCIDGVIAPDDYKKDQASLEAEHDRIADEIAKLNAEPMGDVKPWLYAIPRLKQAPFSLAGQTHDEIRLLLKSLTLSLKLCAKKLLIQAAEPYATFAAWRQFPTVSG